MTNDPSAFGASQPAEPRASLLLVDDQPANLLALETILADLGPHLVKASSGEEALRKVLEHDFAVVLLDVQMHGLDGFETAKLIRSRKRSRHTPIIFLTAHDDNRLTVAEAYALGAVDYLVKPTLPVVLRAKVKGFIELFQKTEQVKRQAQRLREFERREFEAKLEAERRQATQALRQSEHRFTQFMQYLPGLAWIKDLEGRYVYINDAAEKVFGAARDVLLGKTDDDIFPPEVAAQFQANDRQAVVSGTGIQVVETLTQADGVQHHSIVAKFPIPGPDGVPALVGGMAVDITEQKRAQAVLEESDRRKDEFLAMLAHELRNPLASIRNAVQVCRLLTDGPAAPTVGPSLSRARDIIERQVHHLTRMVDDLLDVSRIQRGKVALRLERLDLVELVRVTVEDHRMVVEQAGLVLGLKRPSGPVWVQGDPTRLTQVMGNLLQNALKFTDGGGQVEVEVAVEPNQCQAVVSVRDTGVGIDPLMLTRVFETFSQADRSLDRSKGGLGLGLALVKGLVELHGGEVHAASAGPGKGAAFVIQIPALAEELEREEQRARASSAEPPALTYSPCPPDGEPKARRSRVLVVEDNEDAAESVRTLLELLGHEVVVAHSGPAGVSLAVSWRPDVILCDIGLPGLDGYAVVGELRRNPLTAQARVIAITGYGTEADRLRARQAGFDLHLTKPVDPDELVAVVSSY
jgi:PAS domain S-box-containing protein